MFLCNINQFLCNDDKPQISKKSNIQKIKYPKNKKKIKVITIECYPTAMNPSTNPTLEDLKTSYLKSFTEKETQAYLIAKGHLGTSFTLEKSNGYLSWLKDQSLEPQVIIAGKAC
jgi:hypothetical protein